MSLRVMIVMMGLRRKTARPPQETTITWGFVTELLAIPQRTDQCSLASVGAKDQRTVWAL